MPPLARRIRPVLLAASLAVGGCVSIQYQQDPLEQAVINQQPAQALTILEKENHKNRNATLYHLNKAVLLRMQGEFKASNAELEAAKKIDQELEAISLREQAAAVTVNDAMRSYLPPPFERAMLHCLEILNYLQMNDVDGARVEALQQDVFLTQHYDKKEPPFARYLNGLVFEADGELSDAMIAYRKAYQAFRAAQLPVPKQLQADLLRLTDYLELNNEHDKLQEQFKLKHWPTQAQLNKQGEVIAIVLSGLVPRKHETSIMAQDPESGQLHRISIPFYETRQAQVENMKLVSLNNSSEGELFARLDRQAYASLDDAMPGIIARAVARVVVKNKLSDNMAERNQLLGAITNIAGFITEQADTRGWNMLPQDILVARLALAPGSYDIHVELDNSLGKMVGSETEQQVALRPKQKRVYSWHWPASHVTSRNPSHETNFSTTIHYRHRVD
jgi:hypothetical protein